MPNSGHWTGLCKYYSIYEHFDSYGVMPDTELHWISPKMRESLHEKVPYLSRLLNKKPYLHNTVRYQSEEHSVNTCGSHVSHRLYRLKNDGMTLKDYHDYMRELRKDTQRSYDYIVADWVKKVYWVKDVCLMMLLVESLNIFNFICLVVQY